MKKITLLLLFIASLSYGQKLNLNQIQYAPGSGYIPYTDATGKLTYSLLTTVSPTTGIIQGSLTANYIPKAVSSTSLTNSGISDDGIYINLNYSTRVTNTNNNGILNIMSPSGYFYPSLGFYNNGGSYVGGIQGYSGSLYFGGSSGLNPLVVSGTDVNFPMSTPSSLSYFDASKDLKSVTLGSGLSLTGGTLTATGSGDSTILTASTNIVINGTAPNYTISTPTQTTGLIGLTNLSATSPINYNNTTGNFSLTPLTITNTGSGNAAITGNTLNIPNTTYTLTQAGVYSALTYTPYNSTNPNGYISTNQNITLSGDITGSGSTAIATTLSTVNSNVGTFGGAASINTITVNGKGLVTGIGSQSIQIAESQVTNLVSDLAGKADKLNTVLSSYLEVPEQTTPATPTNSIRLYTDASNRLSWVGENGFTRTFDGTANTANRMYTLQDKAGTIAHLDDITGSSNLPLIDAISQLNTPPAHVAGERYLINTAPTGAWVGFANNIAQSNGTTWAFTSPTLNNTIYLTSVALTYKYNGTIWVQGGAVPVLHNGNSLGINLSVGTNDAFDFLLKRGNVQKASVTSTGFAIRNAANTFNAELQSAATSNVTLALPLVTSTIVGQSLAGVVNRTPYYDANGLLTSSAQLAYAPTTAVFSNIFSQNGITNFNCVNTSAGAASATQYNCANGTYNYLIKLLGSGFAVNGLVKPHTAVLQTNGVGGLLISSVSIGTDILFTNGGQTSADETFRISTGGLTNTKAAATAGLHLKAGTATASTAPLKLTAGTNLTVAENGAIEYDGNDLSITVNATRQIIHKGKFGSFSQAGTATTVFTVVFGGTQPNTTYKVSVTPTSLISAAAFYVTNKTTTSFDVTYTTGLTGTVTLDYLLTQ